MNVKSIQARDGLDAVKSVEPTLAEGQKTFDYIFMDQIMPVMTGSEATAAIRKLGFTNPVVAVTGNALEEDKVHILSCGANHVITKPLKISDLEAVFDGLQT